MNAPRRKRVYATVSVDTEVDIDLTDIDRDRLLEALNMGDGAGVDAETWEHLRVALSLNNVPEVLRIAREVCEAITGRIIPS